MYCIYYKGQLKLKYDLNYTDFCKKVRNEIQKNLPLDFDFDIYSFNKLLRGRQKNYKGIEIKSFNSKEIPEFIISKAKHNNQKILKNDKIANYFYVFDTESTNVKNEYALTYLYGMRKYKYNYNLNDENIEEYAEEYQAFTNVSDFVIFLENIEKEAIKNAEYVYIFVHNLIYDLYELLQNVFNKFELSKTDIGNCIEKSIFRGAISKPLIFNFKHLFFVDSLALTNKSLIKISQNHKIKKLIELKTYKEQYFFNSKLPTEELSYNKNDLDVTALGIMDSIRSCKTYFETFNDFAQQRINTVTGISKYLNKHIYNNNADVKNINQHTIRASENLPVINDEIDKDRLLLYQKIFQGGYTHANPLVAYRIINNSVRSFDKKSHYPATMLMRRFPFNFEKKETKLAEIIKMHNINCELAEVFDTHKFIDNMLAVYPLTFNQKHKTGTSTYVNPIKYHFLGCFELSNVIIKNFNNSIMPLIAFSKTDCEHINILNVNNLVCDNGKILKANKIKVYATSIDLLAYQLFYDFNITDFTDFEIANNTRFLDNYINDTLRFHMVNKDEISKCIKGEKDIEDLISYSNDKLFSKSTIENFKKMSVDEQEDFLNSEYMATKTNGINNQYGINVQKIINNDIYFDFNKYDFVIKENVIQGCRGLQTTRDYISGLYITAFARFDLALMTYIFCRKSNLQVAYWDTDSIKVICKSKKDYQEADRICNFYNYKFKKIQQYIENKFGKLFNIGIFENDFNYDKFFTMGAKKYLTVINNEIEITNAGVNKNMYSSFLNEQYKKCNYDFDYLINNFYRPNILIGSNLTGRKTIKYPKLQDSFIDEILIDENGEKQHIAQYPTALICDSNYKLQFIDFKNPLNKLHFQLCQKLQKEIYGDFNLNTEYKEIGEIVKESTDDFDNWKIF